MKRLLGILTTLVLLLAASGAFGASSCDQDTYKDQSLPAGVKIWGFSWVADTDGSFTNCQSDQEVNAYVIMVITDPGATAPTDNYDITILSTEMSGGTIDIMGGELANRDTADTEQAVPKIGSTVYGTRFVRGKITLTISNNSVNSAAGVVLVYIWDGRR